MKATEVPYRTSVGTIPYTNLPSSLEVITDVRAAVGQIVSLGNDLTFSGVAVALISRDPSCDPNCSFGPGPGTPTIVSHWMEDFLKGRGMTIDGAHSGTGLILEIPDFSIKVPWAPASEQLVSLRLLLR
jgi:hypothetical protein